MKNILKISMIGLMLILSLVNTVKAESISLSITCRIPAIPGVNAPLIEEEKIKTEPPKTTPEEIKIKNEPKEETKTQTSAMIPQDKEETISAERNDSQLIVKTIYAR